MATRVYLCIELTHDDGPTVRQEELRVAYEESLEDVLEVHPDGSLYKVEVLGMGSTPLDLSRSMNLRRDQVKRNQGEK